jgi:Cdc6-like AAA superfamily ATPase
MTSALIEFDVKPHRVRERFRVRPEGQDEIERIKGAIRDMDVCDGFSLKAADELDRLVAAAREGKSGYAIVITGESGSGKSHVVDRFCEQEIFDPFEENPEEGFTTPLVHVQAPAPCTLITLGRAIYRKLTGEDLMEGLKEHVIWDRVRAQLKGQAVSILVIDEMHHVLIGKSQEEHRKVAETLKNILQKDDWPVHMVLAGMPTLKVFCENHPQLRRRCRFKTIKPVSNDQKGHEQIAKYMELLRSKLPPELTANFNVGDFPERIRLASEGLLGRVAMFVKLAALLAVDRRHREITVTHFADEYEVIYECGDRRNPFKASDLKALKPITMKEDASRLTRLRGRSESEAYSA